MLKIIALYPNPRRWFLVLLLTLLPINLLCLADSKTIKTANNSGLKNIPSDLNRKNYRRNIKKEVEEAFLDLKSFRDRPKFPGLTEADRLKFRNNFLPDYKDLHIEKDSPQDSRVQKLAARVFFVHNISDQCEAVVVTRTLPTVFTWKLTFIVITTGSLKILSDEEIIALMSHEAGHLYYVDELRKVRYENDARAARIIELKADIAALETLDQLQISHLNLLSALKKLIDERSRLKVNSITEMSPTLEDRALLIKEFESRQKRKTLFADN